MTNELYPERNNLSLTTDIQSLKDELSELKNYIDSFDKNYAEATYGIQVSNKIKELSEKKGKFLWIKYDKEPTSKDLLDIDRDIINQTNESLTNTYEKIAVLHKTDERIFKLLCVLAGLSGMTYARIKDAYTVIDDAQKNIDSNCDVTSEQGKRIKQIALMHLQRIQEDKERYEKLEAFINKYTNEIDVLAARYGNLEQFIEAKKYAMGKLFSIEKERIERNITDLQTTIKQEIDDYEKNIVQNIDKKLDDVKGQLDSILQDSNEVLKRCELEKREIESICAEAKKSLQLKQDDVSKLFLAEREKLNQAVNNYIVTARDDLSKIEKSLREELERLHEGNVRLLNESRQLTEKAVDQSEGLIHNMTLLFEKMDRQSEATLKSMSEKQDEINKASEENISALNNAVSHNLNKINTYLVDYEEKLSRKYRKRFTFLSVAVCGISILTTLIICFILK